MHLPLIGSVVASVKVQLSTNIDSTTSHALLISSQRHSEACNPQWLAKVTLVICLLSLIVTSHVLYRLSFGLLYYMAPNILELYAIWFGLNAGMCGSSP